MSQPVVTPQQATGARSKPDTLTNEQRKTRLAWIFLAPSLLMIAIVAIWPLLQTLYQSFTDAILASPQPVHFVGLDNYKRLVQDLAFRDSIATTVRFTVITVVFETLLGMIIALVINSNFKGRGLMRTAMLVPWAIPTVVSAEMWQWMYNDVYGVIDDLLIKLHHLIVYLVHWAPSPVVNTVNDLLTTLHITDRPIAFLALPSTALPAVAAIDIWKTTPFMALLLLAGLQVIPSDVYEAAKIDGASGVQQYFRITLPLLRPALLVALIFRTLDALRVFDVIYVVFGNRPDTMTMAVYNQENIVNFSDLGYGTTISVAIFIIIALFVLAYVSIFKVETD